MVAIFIAVSTSHGGEANAQSPSESSICRIGSIQGRATAKRHDGAQWEPVRLNDTFSPGDRIQTGKYCRIAIVLANDTVLRINESTSVVFSGIQEERSFLVELIQGAVHFFSRKARSLKVTTPFVNALVEGTEFLVKVETDHTLISLFEGRVLADNAQGSRLLSKGQSVVAYAGQAPALKAIARPRDAVQWTLYYPSIIDFDINGGQSPYPEELRSKLNQSMAAQRRGDVDRALDIIDSAGKNIGDAAFYIYRAGLSLTVGRAAQALADIQRAMDLQADNDRAYALRAIIAVAQNRKAAAYADAQKAVALNPDSAAAHIALSYAHQARFNLAEATQAAQTAVKKAPGHAIARARLAELRLSSGDLNGALRAAQRAVDLNPNNSRARTVLGYANLTRINIASAKENFDKAIELDSAAPLPRLGLGLAKIRQGHLASGRADIELAAGLDPGNALIRSYLGKAYFDEKRSPLEARQLEIAKELDPMDPTPWFYDAIRKQTQNRPVEALQDLQKSIELNNHRAVYRSRLLMDEDLAARSASLGRIYNDLGFEELALRQGWRSLQADPSNYSAHRLLADSYSSRPRHEIARVSELLQAQLLQPLSLTPVQPQLAESNLLIPEGAGPGSASFNEFNPLFARNRISAQIDGLVGDNSTWGEEIALSGIYNRISGSVGQYHYETDGFRDNNDLDQDIYGGIVQAALPPKVNMQAEYRNRADKSGDLSFFWDLDNPDTSLLIDRETETLRTGLHLKPLIHSDIIASLIYLNRDFRKEYPDSSVEHLSEGYSSEIQYLYNNTFTNFIAGIGHYEIEKTSQRGLNTPTNKKKEHNNGYAYTQIGYPNNTTWTIGASYDKLNQTSLPNKEKFNPKFCVTMDISKSTLLRLAAFTGVKRALLADQTIEPTNIAGFNQFFDDFDGAEYVLYGVGLDHKINDAVYGGAEFSYRELQHPIIDGSRIIEEEREENLVQLYLNCVLNKHTSLGIKYQIEDFRVNEKATSLSMAPETNTQILPVRLSYSHPSGLFGKLVTTYVSQKVEWWALPEISSSDEFLLVDMTIGYRLPKRYGRLSLDIRNVFDEGFNYMDDTWRSSQDIMSPIFLPERNFIFRIAISI